MDVPKNNARLLDPIEEAPPPRVRSVDALRGFDMFWLVGGTGLGIAMAKLCPQPLRDFGVRQLDHVAWEGCTFYDLIFPLFAFVVGMSVVFSLGRLRDTEPVWSVYRRIFRRFALLFVLGILYYGGSTEPWPNIRILGVLQRLALCYLFVSILYYHFRTGALITIAAAILMAYWALFTFVPVPGTGETSFTEASNWARYVDELLLPGRKQDGTWDNCGILGTFPAVTTCLLGVLAAIMLKSDESRGARKAIEFMALGVSLAVAGWAWGHQFPIIKKVWTSSYVLYSGGYCFLLLGLFYLIVDVWGFHRWATPFLWIGANPLTLYLARNIMDFNELADRFTGGTIAEAVGPDYAYLLKTAVSLAFSLLLVRFLYKKGIFLRV